MSPREKKTQDWRHNDRPEQPRSAMPPARKIFAVGVEVKIGRTMPPETRRLVGHEVGRVREVISTSVVVVGYSFGTVFGLKTDWRIK